LIGVEAFVDFVGRGVLRASVEWVSSLLTTRKALICGMSVVIVALPVLLDLSLEGAVHFWYDWTL
jgi:hypothetical protein